MAKQSASSQLSADVSDIRGAFLRLARRLRQQRSVSTITVNQFAVLANLSSAEVLSLGDLADRECVSAPSMNRTVNGLVDLGYVSRTENGADRRKVDIAMTAAGKKVVRDTVRRRDQWIAELLDRLDESERQKFRDVAAIILREVER